MLPIPPLFKGTRISSIEKGVAGREWWLDILIFKPFVRKSYGVMMKLSKDLKSSDVVSCYQERGGDIKRKRKTRAIAVSFKSVNVDSYYFIVTAQV